LQEGSYQQQSYKAEVVVFAFSVLAFLSLFFINNTPYLKQI